MKKLFAVFALFFCQSLLAEVAISTTEQAEEQVVEHCKAFGERTVCYLQLTDGLGHSSFIATEEDFKLMQIDPAAAQDAGMDLSVVTEDEYSDIVATRSTGRINYANFVVTPAKQQTIQDGVIIAPMSWRCSLGVAGSMGGGGLAGAPFGPIGVGLGALSGAMLGIANFCL